MATSGSKKIILRSFDKQEFEVEEVVAMEMQAIKHMIEDDCANDKIPVPNVHSKTLSKVLEYCRKHVETDNWDELNKWDAEFMKVDIPTLFDIVLAANYLNVKGLFDLTCQTIAYIIRDKPPEEIREIFNIENDYTPEEEAKVRLENAWAFL